MKKILLSVMLAAALASCTKEENGKNPAGDFEIMAGATALSVDAVTKAPINAIPAGGLLARVPVSEISGNYTAEWQSNAGYMKFTPTSTSTATGFADDAGVAAPKFYPAEDNKTTYLCGLYPSEGWTVGTNATLNFDGKTDVMAAKEVSTTKADAATSSFKTLAFQHLLTQLRIQFVAPDANAANAWGSISSLELQDADGNAIGNKVTVDLKAGTGTFAVGDASFGFYKMTGEDQCTDNAYSATTVTTTQAYVAYVLAPSVTATSTSGLAEYKLKITSAGGATETVDINLKAADNNTDYADYTAGKAFDIVLSFRATEIKAMATIATWTDMGTTEVPVGE